MALVRHSCALALSEILMYAHEPFGDIGVTRPMSDSGTAFVRRPSRCVIRLLTPARLCRACSWAHRLQAHSTSLRCNKTAGGNVTCLRCIF